MSGDDAFVERPCIDCGEPTCNTHGRCRDCNLDYLFDSMACQSCGEPPNLVKREGSPLGVVLEAHDDRGACPVMAL